jgi:hypothetical protein
LFKVHITTLYRPVNLLADLRWFGRVSADGRFLKAGCTHGLAAQNAKRKPVLIQLIAPSETLKYSDAVVDTAENVSHYR